MRHRSLVAFLGIALAFFIVLEAPVFSQGRGQAPPANKPIPRWADGKPNFGAEVGVWLPADARFARPDNDGQQIRGNQPFPGKPKVSEVPFQPWAKGVYEYRLENELEPHTRCKPSGGARQFFTPYGVEFVDLPDLKRIFIMDIGGPHTWRTIYMDGRQHPKDLVPTFYGHSIGHWEGETLVIDTVGFNEKFWMDREGSPHTEKLHFIERLTRVDYNTMKYEITIDDPGAYTKPWTTGMYLRWSPGQELFEYVCQDNNFAPNLMVGAAKSVDRSSQIIP